MALFPYLITFTSKVCLMKRVVFLHQIHISLHIIQKQQYSLDSKQINPQNPKFWVYFLLEIFVTALNSVQQLSRRCLRSSLHHGSFLRKSLGSLGKIWIISLRYLSHPMTLGSYASV